jgi:plastocyanin
MQRFGTLTALAAVCALAACGGGGGTGSATAPAQDGNMLSMPLGQDMVIDAKLPKNTIGEELPSEGVGTEKDPLWGTVGGYTQTTKAQVLAFPPGTKITIRNLSKSLPHTLDVVMKAGKPPAKFPTNPSLPIMAQGGGVLAVGYASGTIEPGKSVTVTLSKKGTYLIGCAFHYSEGMQDVIEVNAKATPGPSGK